MSYPSTQFSPVRRDVLEALPQAESLRSLDARALGRVAATARVRRMRRHERVWSSGDPSNEIVVVLSGRIQCAVVGAGDRGWVRTVARAGDTCGLAALVDQGPHPCTAEALESSRVVVLDAALLRELLVEDPAFSRHISRLIVGELRQAVEACVRLAVKSPLQRLAAYLIENASSDGQVSLAETQGQIAAQIGTVREVVGRAFRRLQGDGLLARSGRSIRILDATALERVAG